MMAAITLASTPQLNKPQILGATAVTTISPTAKILTPQPSDKFSHTQTKATSTKPMSKLGSEKKWLISGACITGITSFVVSTIWLWSTIGNKRFSSWEGLHANIPMATLGGVIAGGAGGVLSCRFINSIKNRLNGTVEEKPEAIINIPVQAKAEKQ
jgi:hypothetical protein